MATFAEKSFDSNNYNQNRPKYPHSLYEALFKYHDGGKHTAVDIGCGPGTASFQLLQYVDNVIATDPSNTMVTTGLKSITPDVKDRIRFEVAYAEDLHKVVPQDGSVDLIVSAEALHWVDHPKFFKEASRILRSGGTLAYWAYISPRFVDHPKATEIYDKYEFEDPRYLKTYWSEPGKSICKSFYNDIKVPTELFTDIEKHDYIPGETKTHTAFFLGDDKYTLKKLRANMTTWSGTHKWREQHAGEDREDIVDLFINELKDTLGWDDDTEVTMEYGTTYVFARKP